jgi:lipopolysaccharide/colanic/teichoic acid biosynthesis glycosyltransferase
MTRRIVDIVVSGVLLVATAPAIAVIALLVRLTSAGPAFHRDPRVGRDGREFMLWKFRTMRTNTTGPAVTAADDPRITSLGRRLRAWKLDEVPQLVNVVRGDMTLVGPRPESPRLVPLYDRTSSANFGYAPGLTSPASIAFRDEGALIGALLASGHDLDSTYRRLIRAKTAIDLAYMTTRTARSDLEVVVATALAIVKPGAALVRRYERPAAADLHDLPAST